MSVLVDDIATALTSEGVVGGATGWTVKKLVRPDSGADKIVCVYPLGGGPDEDTRNELVEPRFQIIVRGEPEIVEATQTKMNEVIDALDDCESAVGSGYVIVKREGSGFEVMGVDSQRRLLLGATFRTMRDA